MAALPEEIIRGIVIANFGTNRYLNDLMVEIARLESGFNPTAMGAAGEYGIWQIHPVHIEGLREAAIIRHPTDLLEPMTNGKAAKWVYDRQGAEAWTTAEEAAKNIDNENLITGGITDAIDTALPGNPISWMDALGNFFGIITNPDFWKRVGLGALGAAVIVAAITFWNKDEIISTAGALK